MRVQVGAHSQATRQRLHMEELVASRLSITDLCSDHDERHAIHPHYLHTNLQKAH